MRGYHSIWFVDIEMRVEMSAHLFVISRDVLQAVLFTEVKETVKAMYEAGVFRAPFEEVDVIINASVYEFQTFVDPEWTPSSTTAPDELFSMIVKYKSNNDGFDAYFCGRNDKLRRFISVEDAIERYKNSPYTKDVPKFADELRTSIACIYGTLVVLLATKNIEKRTQEVKVKKHALLSRKRKSAYKYSGITELHIGKISETFSGDGSRGPVRAHLRRGHVRNQRIGEGRKDVKQIFIQPVFVNADDGWIENQRKEYRIKI